MKLASFSRLVAVLGLAAALVTGCSRDPNVRKQKYLRSGLEYFAQGSYREAAIEFSNATQIDPGYAEAHYRLAQTYLKQQQFVSAYRELTRTLELEPENYGAHRDIANLLLAARELKQSQEHSDLLLTKRPNDPEVHLLASSLLAAQENLPGAVQEAEKAIALDGKRSDSFLTLAYLQMRSGLPDAAEANFVKAVQVDPKSANPHLALGSYYQSRARFLEAEQQYRQAAAMEPHNPASRTALVRLYVSLGEKAEAEAVLKQAKRDFADDSAGYRMLGDFYFASADVDKALAEYESLYHEHGKDLQVKKNYIQLLILKNRFEEARKLDDELLKSMPGDADGLVYRGQIQLREGKTNDAEATLQAAVESDPQSGVAHYHLGATFDQQGNAARAASEWHEALRLRPDLVEAHRALANLALRQGDQQSLEHAASDLIRLQPDAPDGYLLHATAAMNHREFDDAELDIRKAIQVAPQSAVGYVQLGGLKLAQKKYADAEKAYQDALGRDATSGDALKGLMTTYLAQKQVDKAVAAAHAQIGKVPASSSLFDLLGTVLFNDKKDPTGAEAAFKKSLELDKNNTAALVKLAQVLSARGADDEAIAAYQRFFQEHPREVGLRILAGELYERKRDWQNARHMYQKALDLSPDNAVASNHLAAVLLESGGSPEQALLLAEAARRGLPDSASAADTLGWVYYRKGLYKLAVGLGEEALKLSEEDKSVDDAAIHYHLALAYQKTDQSALARQHLERALKINPSFDNAEDARKLIAQLR